MSSNPESFQLQLLNDGPAANADQLGEAQRLSLSVAKTTGGWDPYEVWQRLIKEPRDRRRSDKGLF